MTTANAIRSLRETLERLGKVEPAPPWECSPWHIEEGEPAVRKFGYGIVCNAPSDDLAALIVAYRNNHAQILSALRVAEVVPEIEKALREMTSGFVIANGNLTDGHIEQVSREDVLKEFSRRQGVASNALAALQSAKEPTP